MSSKSIKVTVLGTGTSTGIPMVGCQCRVCSSTDPRDKRLRTSLLIESGGKTILIDTSPDLRYQLLKHSIMTVDAAVITHDHADHLHGIDDLRPFCFGPPTKTIPIICSETVGSELKIRFPYIFRAKELFHDERPVIGGGIPHLELKEIATSRTHKIEVNICESQMELFSLPHGYTETIGLIHQNFAYIPDCSSIADELVDELNSKKLDLIIIDCLQEEKHETHLNFAEAFHYIKRIAPKRAGLIHMNHETLHRELEEKANEYFGDSEIDVFPLVDGQSFTY